MKVRALKPGFFGYYREEGEVFEVPSGAKGAWFTPAEPKGPQSLGKSATAPAPKGSTEFA
jgi:hypothetical protein